MKPAAAPGVMEYSYRPTACESSTMRITLPGQLKGPECRRVISQAIMLRRLLESWLEAQTIDQLDELTILLRVDGSLGSFGPPGVENVELGGRKLSCDLVIADPDWARLDDRQIGRLLRERVLETIGFCFRIQGIEYGYQELAKHLELSG